METGTGQNQAKNAPGMLHIPLNVLTQTFQNLAKRASTGQQKHYLFVVGETLGSAISKQYPGGGPSGGFSPEEWMTECGIQNEWAQLAA